eukprot:3240332-Pyramimonas_sp.AAC.1
MALQRVFSSNKKRVFLRIPEKTMVFQQFQNILPNRLRARMSKPFECLLRACRRESPLQKYNGVHARTCRNPSKVPGGMRPAVSAAAASSVAPN